MIEIDHHAVGQSKVIRREDEPVGPAVKLLQHAIGTHSGLSGTQRRHTDGTDMMSGSLRLVDRHAGLGRDDHLLGTHLMLRQVLDLDTVETAQSAVDGDEREVDAANLQTLHQFTTEVQA